MPRHRGRFLVTIYLPRGDGLVLNLVPSHVAQKHVTDETVARTGLSKVKRLFNPLSWHAYEVCATLSWFLSLMADLFFICAAKTVEELRRKKTQEGVKLVPGGQVWLMCHAALELCCDWNKDTYGSHWLEQMIWWSLSKWLTLAGWDWTFVFCCRKTPQISRAITKSPCESKNAGIWGIFKGWITSRSE